MDAVLPRVSCIIVTSRGDAPLVTAATHMPLRARDLISALRLGLHRSVGLVGLGAGCYPDSVERSDALIIGAYPDAFILAEHRLVDACFLGDEHPFVQRLLSVFPASQVLAIKILRDTGLFGYAYYAAGECQRVFQSSSVDGVLADSGAWLPEEKPYYDGSVMRDGQRLAALQSSDGIELFPAAAYADEIICELTRRVAGRRLDDPALTTLAMEAFAPRSPQPVLRRIQRAWGRGLSDSGPALAGGTLSVVRRGQWLYADAVPQDVRVLAVSGFDTPALSDDTELRDFFVQEDGRAVAYLVIFGPLHAHAIETASSGLFRTLEEACAAAEDRTPSSIRWQES